MRYGKYLIILLMATLPIKLLAQTDKPAETDITGLWKGTLYNDSTKQHYRYEIGLSEEKGKLTGFSHTWYNERDYFVVKKVKAKRKDGKIIIEDVDIIAYNYPEIPPKGVRRLHVLTLETWDSILVLTGSFSTNQTKTYAPATGTVTLQRKNDYRKQSDLMAHLQELGLDNSLSFVAKDKEIERQEEEKSLTKSQAAVNAGAPLSKNAPVKEISIKNPGKKRIDIKPLPDNKSITETGKKDELAKSASADPGQAAAEVRIRKNVIQETMSFKTDSLELALYDNGEVDGDTVSVLMNGNVIMAKQRLSTIAIRKTVHIPPDMDSIELVMYAENLGTLPPNSGLLVVKDGRDTYEVRFSGDLQRNAAVILKRRKN